MLRKQLLSHSTFISKQLSVYCTAVIVSLCLFVSACGGGKAKDVKKPEGPKGLQAEVVVVMASSLNSMYQSSGNLLANEEISVYPEVSGRITAINFKEGTNVRKGDLLVQLNDTDFKAQIQKLVVQKKLQLTTKGRQDELLAINGISRQEYDVTVAQIASIDADIAFNEAQLRRLQIRAPFDGVIGLRNVSVGAVVSPTSLITVIQQVHPLKLDFPLPEQYQGVVKNGDEVRFTVAGNTDTMKGKVIAIQPGADATTRTITMRAVVPNPNRILVPGSFANVFLNLKTDNNAITIPSQCIIPTSRDKKVAVLRDGKAKMVTVVTGMRMTEDVEILQGLQPGDTVVATGIMQVKDDMPVKVTKVRG